MVKLLDADYFDPSNQTDASWPNIDEFLDIPFELPPPLEQFPTAILRLEKNEPPTDYFTVGSLKIVSEKFRHELDRASAEFEFFPVDLLTKRGHPHCDHRFYFAHLLKVIDCFDYDRSIYDFDKYREGFVGRVHQLHIRENAVGEETVFWIQNVNFPQWLVSNAFAEQIQTAGITGIVLYELKDAISK